MSIESKEESTSKMSSSSDNSKDSRKGIKRRRTMQYCSTPSGSQHPPFEPNVSISTVEGGSSSSRKKQKVTYVSNQQPRVEKPRRKKRKKQKPKPARVEERHSDSDWETKSETSVIGHASPDRVEVEKVPSAGRYGVLFDSLGSPERIREAVYPVEDRGLDSPVVRPRETQKLSAINEDLGEPDAPLPLEIVQLLNEQDLEIIEDDELYQLQRRECGAEVVKLYSRQVSPRKSVSLGWKREQWLVSPRLPVAAANLLWDDYVKEHPEQFRGTLEYVSSSDESLELNRIFDNYHALKKMDNNKSGDVHADQPARPRSRMPSMKWESPEKNITRGWWDMSRNKWIHDPPMVSSDEDDDIETDSSTAKTITHIECCESSNNKPRIRSIQTLTTLKYERIGEKTWKITKK